MNIHALTLTTPDGRFRISHSCDAPPEWTGHRCCWEVLDTVNAFDPPTPEGVMAALVPTLDQAVAELVQYMQWAEADA